MGTRIIVAARYNSSVSRDELKWVWPFNFFPPLIHDGMHSFADVQWKSKYSCCATETASCIREYTKDVKNTANVIYLMPGLFCIRSLYRCIYLSSALYVTSDKGSDVGSYTFYSSLFLRQHILHLIASIDLDRCIMCLKLNQTVSKAGCILFGLCLLQS